MNNFEKALSDRTSPNRLISTKDWPSITNYSAGDNRLEFAFEITSVYSYIVMPATPENILKIMKRALEYEDGIEFLESQYAPESSASSMNKGIKMLLFAHYEEPPAGCINFIEYIKKHCSRITKCIKKYLVEFWQTAY